MKEIYVIGGGTISHVRNHLALCAPAYGSTATEISDLLKKNSSEYLVKLCLSNMAGGFCFETNDDLAQFSDSIINNLNAKIVFFNAACVDFNGQIGNTLSGKYAKRMESSAGRSGMILRPSAKIIGKFRKQRKDLFVVGFKTTADATPDEQYLKGLKLLKENSLNLVLANDTVTRHNMIIAPEETRYCETTNRSLVLKELVKMALARASNTFTRSTVVDGESIAWSSELIPDNLRAVVNHCIKEGAYKPFLGKTAGHFAVKHSPTAIFTSKRKSNFNELERVGLVKIESSGPDSVIAYGAKPSVGGQSQRIIFSEHSEDCIVHFHCPPKARVKTADQWPFECGSHECGKNTSRNLEKVDLGDGHSLKVVYLDRHGPNIVFDKDTPAEKVMNFIDSTFDLKLKTGGLVEIHP